MKKHTQYTTTRTSKSTRSRDVDGKFAPEFGESWWNRQQIKARREADRAAEIIAQYGHLFDDPSEALTVFA